MNIKKTKKNKKKILFRLVLIFRSILQLAELCIRESFMVEALTKIDLFIFYFFFRTESNLFFDLRRVLRELRAYWSTVWYSAVIKGWRD